MSRVPGVTDEETLNVAILGDNRMANVSCGADIVLTGLYQDSTGEAHCPICGNKVKVGIRDRHVSSVSPSSAPFHYVVEDKSRFSICCAAPSSST